MAVVDGKYRLGERIGSGSFGEIFMGHTASGKRVAVKCEKKGGFMIS
jgi:hypothetical protein